MFNQLGPFPLNLPAIPNVTQLVLDDDDQDEGIKKHEKIEAVQDDSGNSATPGDDKEGKNDLTSEQNKFIINRINDSS